MAKIIRLFLSSPGDVEGERKKVSDIVAQINRTMGDLFKVRLEVIEWKTHVVPDMGRPQEVINEQMKDYDIFVGIMWKRFGTPSGKAESGTKEEFDIACANWQKFGRPRILFYFSQKHYSPQNAKKAEQWVKVLHFKEELAKKGLIFEYQTPERFAEYLCEHLTKVLREWFQVDFIRYLNYLKDETKYIDIRGLVTGKGKAHQFCIDQLYIPPKTTGRKFRRKKSSSAADRRLDEMVLRDVPLEEALQESRLIIRGDPGTGKTTFLRLMAYTLCNKMLGEGDDSKIHNSLWPTQSPLPILVSLGRLLEHIRTGKNKDFKNPGNPSWQEDSPEWLLHFLDVQGSFFNWQLPAGSFRCELEAGRCLILLDGLDEAPDVKTRHMLISLVDKLVKAYPNCRVVLTSRPVALVGPTILPGFSLANIAPLDDSGIKTFLTQWCAALNPKAPERACQYQEELSRALQSRPEIGRMARTPVMLTALAVVHWNENRLPEQRAELGDAWEMGSRLEISVFHIQTL